MLDSPAVQLRYFDCPLRLLGSADDATKMQEMSIQFGIRVMPY